MSICYLFFPTHSFNAGVEPRSPALQVDSLPAEPQGKPIYYLFSKINFPIPTMSCWKINTINKMF